MESEKWNWLITLTIVLLIVLAFGIYYVNNIDVPYEARECLTDSDCVPRKCCHPTTCVPLGQQENCAAVLCTAECASGTLDCGQGSCLCINGKCRAEI